MSGCHGRLNSTTAAAPADFSWSITETAYLDDDRQVYDFFYLLQDFDVELFRCARRVFGGGVDFLNVEFEGGGSRIFQFGGEFYPFSAVVAVDAGDDGHGDCAARFFDEGEVFFDFVGAYRVLQEVARFGIVGAVEQLFALGVELLLKERFQYDGADACFFEGDDFVCAVCLSRACCDNGISEFQSGE